MKRFLVLFTCVAILFSASCSDDNSEVNNNNPTPPDTPPTPNENLTVQALKDDNSLIYASGGSTTISVTSELEWAAEVVDSEDSEWLHLTQTDNSLTLSTDKNTQSSDREAHI